MNALCAHRMHLNIKTNKHWLSWIVSERVSCKEMNYDALIDIHKSRGGGGLLQKEQQPQ